MDALIQTFDAAGSWRLAVPELEPAFPTIDLLVLQYQDPTSSSASSKDASPQRLANEVAEIRKAVEVESLCIVSTLRLQQMMRNIQLLESNRQRALAAWAQVRARHAADTASSLSIPRGDRTRKLENRPRLAVREPAKSVEDDPGERSIPRSNSTINLSSAQPVAADAMQRSHKPTAPSSTVAMAPSRSNTIHTTTLSAQTRPPRSNHWIPLNMNVAAEDEAILRVAPYFGDDDDHANFDVSIFDLLPGQIEHEALGEAEELAIIHILSRHQRDHRVRSEVYSGLANALSLSISEILKANERVRDGPWYRQLAAAHPGTLPLRSLNKFWQEFPRIALSEVSGHAALQALGGREIAFHPDDPENIAKGLGIGLGLQNTDSYVTLVAAYRDFFCRRCYSFLCHHGVEHPMPKKRRDPPPPAIFPSLLAGGSGGLVNFLTSLRKNRRPLSTTSTTTGAVAGENGPLPSGGSGGGGVAKGGLGSPPRKAMRSEPTTAFLCSASSLPLPGKLSAQSIPPAKPSSAEGVVRKQWVDNFYVRRREIRFKSPGGDIIAMSAGSPSTSPWGFKHSDGKSSPFPFSSTRVVCTASDMTPNSLFSLYKTQPIAPPPPPAASPSLSSQQCLPPAEVSALRVDLSSSDASTGSSNPRKRPFSSLTPYREDLRIPSSSSTTTLPLTSTEKVLLDKLVDVFASYRSGPIGLGDTSSSPSVAPVLDVETFVSELLGTRSPHEVREYLQATRHSDSPLPSLPAVADGQELRSTPTTSSSTLSKPLRTTSTTLSSSTSLSSLSAPSVSSSSLKKNSFSIPYEPCDHDGVCSAANGCACILNGTFCEKYCACEDSCRHRYRGCNCRAGCSTKACPCFAASRTCDPDLCGPCGAGIPPVFHGLLHERWTPGQHDTDSYRFCRNLGFSTATSKKLLIGPSNIHGWGCFAAEPIERNEFIAEYGGEVISSEETERRGLVYDKMNCSYLFGMNQCQTIDATRKGSKVKFMNHQESNPNCYPRIVQVNGDHRIGLYAKQSIAVGEEMTFDYRYSNPSAPDWSRGAGRLPRGAGQRGAAAAAATGSLQKAVPSQGGHGSRGKG